MRMAALRAPDIQLVHYIGPDKLKLTQKGVKEYHRLVSEQP